MSEGFYKRIAAELDAISRDNLYKPERVFSSPQSARACLAYEGGSLSILNFCANDYLGLTADQRVIDAAKNAIDRWGNGVASVRFISGTQEIHKELETAIAGYLGYEDALLYAAAFDANSGVFEPLFGETDAIVSDELNHASMIDGIRLSKARRYRYANRDLNDLEIALRRARFEGAQNILIATDGVFSMDGHIAPLDQIVQLAHRCGALLLVDDCHATGVLGPNGEGTAAHRRVADQVDILTGTLGKALGGAMGGFVAARREVIELLRQRSRPYLFSNSLAPSVCGGALQAIEISRSPEGRTRRAALIANATRLRRGLEAAGLDLLPGNHPIVPVMIQDPHRAKSMAARLLELGIYVTSFSFPVVPRDAARIRVQVTASHRDDQIDFAISAFTEIGRELGVISP